MNKILVGTRGSMLACEQARLVIEILQKTYPNYFFEQKIYTSAGDIEQEKPLPLIGQRGLFTKALDQALLQNEIHISVHSHKDLPIDKEGPIVTAAVGRRENAQDVLITKRKLCLKDLPKKAVIGTSSTRRASQILAFNPSFILKDIRGNVDTRINKALDSDGIYDGIVLAYAGLSRLNLLKYCHEILSFDDMLPSPAQGSIAIQCLAGSKMEVLCQAIDHRESRLAVESERGFLFGLGGGCSIPVAAYAHLSDGNLNMRGKVISADGKQVVLVQRSIAINHNFTVDNAFSFGIEVAENAWLRGAKEILENLN